MIAKLIVWGRDRKEALARMAQALSEYQIVGLASNIAFLKRLVESQPFSTADLDTGLIERNQDALFPAARPASKQVLALAAASLLASERDHVAANDPWAQTSGWRMNMTMQRSIAFDEESNEYQCVIAYERDGWTLQHGAATSKVIVGAHDGTDITIKLDDTTVRGTVVRDGDAFHVFHDGTHTTLVWNDPLAHAGESESEGGRLTAPMPGKIVAVLVENGKPVDKGTPLLIMEAMKMEHTISAPADGTVEEVLYGVGDQVGEGAQLLAFKAA
jgi:3-methylcrotonyl-CoA carboxylase alpha subunit